MVAQQKVPKPPYITPEAYLERERKAETKSEYYAGVVVAMAGASPEHAALVFDLSMPLGMQLRGGSCQGFNNDLRVRVPACNAYFYPDVVIVCDEPKYELSAGLRSLLNPTLIIEALSPSTEMVDRQEKFDCYWTLESLKTYVLVSQDRPRIEIYTRQGSGSWLLEVANGLDAVVRLDAVDCE